MIRFKIFCQKQSAPQSGFQKLAPIACIHNFKLMIAFSLNICAFINNLSMSLVFMF